MPEVSLTIGDTPTPKQEGWVLVDPKEFLPCSLSVVVPKSRVDELGRIEQKGREVGCEGLNSLFRGRGFTVSDDWHPVV